jgi:hypothetical protein
MARCTQRLAALAALVLLLAAHAADAGRPIPPPRLPRRRAATPPPSLPALVPALDGARLPAPKRNKPAPAPGAKAAAAAAAKDTKKKATSGGRSTAASQQQQQKKKAAATATAAAARRDAAAAEQKKAAAAAAAAAASAAAAAAAEQQQQQQKAAADAAAAIAAAAEQQKKAAANVAAAAQAAKNAGLANANATPTADETTSSSSSSAAARKSTKLDKIRVLAVGDSVAKGSLPSQGFNHPFTIELARVLPSKMGLPDGAATADTDGIQGCAGFFRPSCDTQENLVESTKRVLAQKRSGNAPKYNWAVLHGGINDFLADGKTAEEVAARIEQVVSMLRAEGMKVVVIPPLAAPGYITPDDPKELQRARLPPLLKKAADERNKQSAQQGGPVVEVVLAEAVAPGGKLDFWPSSRRAEMEDGLHLRIPGYDLMGALAADAIARAELENRA